jgi:hypothetical protein
MALDGHRRAAPEAKADEVARNAGASYEDTLLPATMTLEFPAEEKYATPA